MSNDKVIHLFPSTTEKSKPDLLRVLKGLIDDVEAGKLEYLTIAARLNDGTVATGWAGCNLVQRQELISHLQVDVTYAIVYANLVEE